MPIALGWGGTATTHIPCRSASHVTATLSRPSTSQYNHNHHTITRVRGRRLAGAIFGYCQTPVWVRLFLWPHMPCLRDPGTVHLPIRFPPLLSPPWRGLWPGIGFRAGFGAGHRRDSVGAMDRHCLCPASPPRGPPPCTRMHTHFSPQMPPR